MSMRIVVVSVLALALSGCTPTADDGGGVEVRAAAENLDRPIDAAPTPDGTVIFFLQDVATGQGLFAIDGGGEGDAAPRQVADGLADATSLAISSDANTVVVADATGLTRITADDGTMAAIAEAATYQPRGLDLIPGAAGDIVVFTGIDPTDNTPGVFEVPLAGGTVERIATGFDPAAELDGVTVMADGTAWVTDQRGMVYQVETGSAPETIVTGTIVGDPAGIALTLDETTVLVSSVSAAGTSQVLLIDVAAGTTSVFDDVIRANSGSGGVHRARDLATFAWCGIGAGGTVYRIEF